MKKFAFILIVSFIVALGLSSCTQKNCPAYSKTDTEVSGQNV